MLFLDFYDELLKSGSFCERLGRLLLMSGKLESALKAMVLNSNIKVKYNIYRPTLGQLVSTIKTHKLLTDELNESLLFILDRRNYLTHNLYPLFNEEIEVSLLPRENLSPEDAEYYFTNCVEDLLSYIEFAIDCIDKHK